LGSVEETEIEFRGDRYRLGDSFDIATKCNARDVEENLRQIREARRQADFLMVSLHNQDTIGRSWLRAERLTVALCGFENRQLSKLELYPIEMGFGRPRAQRGRPLLAEAKRGKAILDRIVRLSAAYGARLDRGDGKAVISLTQ
jgi:hypothetical protein